MSWVWPAEAGPEHAAPGQLQIPTAHFSCSVTPCAAGACFPPTLQPESYASTSLHALRPCVFSQIVTKGLDRRELYFLQCGDITCKSSKINTLALAPGLPGLRFPVCSSRGAWCNPRRPPYRCLTPDWGQEHCSHWFHSPMKPPSGHPGLCCRSSR